MGIRNELWIDIALPERDFVTHRFLKGNKCAAGHTVTDALRAMSCKGMKKAWKKAVKAGSYLNNTNRCKKVVAVEAETKRFYVFPSGKLCCEGLGVPPTKLARYCDGKIGNHRWKGWWLFWEWDTAWFDKV